MDSTRPLLRRPMLRTHAMLARRSTTRLLERHTHARLRHRAACLLVRRDTIGRRARTVQLAWMTIRRTCAPCALRRVRRVSTCRLRARRRRISCVRTVPLWRMSWPARRTRVRTHRQLVLWRVHRDALLDTSLWLAVRHRQTLARRSPVSALATRTPIRMCRATWLVHTRSPRRMPRVGTAARSHRIAAATRTHRRAVTCSAGAARILTRAAVLRRAWTRLRAARTTYARV